MLFILLEMDRGLNGMWLCLKAIALPDDIKRPVLGFIVDSADILSDHA